MLAPRVDRVMGRRYCSASDCVSLARQGGLCWAHAKRRQRGGRAAGPVRARLGTWDAVVDAMHDYQDAESDSEFKAARMRVQRAMEAWVTARRRPVCPPPVGG